MPSTQTFFADAVLFDMDGTLTDSIAAVEAAWDKVAKDIGQDPEYVIAATHGKRAVDNLSQFKPHLKAHEIEREVELFEQSILFFADAHSVHGRLATSNIINSNNDDLFESPYHLSPPGSASGTPDLTPGSSAPVSRVSSRAPSIISSRARRPSFGSRLLNMLAVAAWLRVEDEDPFDDCIDDDERIPILSDDAEEQKSNAAEAKHALEAWQLEAASVDRSVRILPGVRKMMDSIPAGRYAVATSGARTYAYGCMKRVGITPPPVTITADDKRLKAGKPAPDPFLLAASCLGYDAARCVVFEDSPSGIQAGVASGATVIAVCTSHERYKLEGWGAHYIVENMESVSCEVGEDGRLMFCVSSLL